MKLPDPKLPDVDILLSDAAVSAVLAGELKWMRKTARVVEHFDKDTELEKGFQQLREVKAFMEGFPDYLKQQMIGPGIFDPR